MREYQSIERVFLLLFLLNNAPAAGCSREEIFARIDLYDAKATARMFERDLALLEKLGFTVERVRKGRKGASYRIIHAEHVLTRGGSEVRKGHGVPAVIGGKTCLQTHGQAPPGTVFLHVDEPGATWDNASGAYTSDR